MIRRLRRSPSRKRSDGNVAEAAARQRALGICRRVHRLCASLNRRIFSCRRLPRERVYGEEKEHASGLDRGFVLPAGRAGRPHAMHWKDPATLSPLRDAQRLPPRHLQQPIWRVVCGAARFLYFKMRSRWRIDDQRDSDGFCRSSPRTHRRPCVA
jgi:hypothetical protein